MTRAAVWIGLGVAAVGLIVVVGLVEHSVHAAAPAKSPPQAGRWMGASVIPPGARVLVAFDQATLNTITLGNAHDLSTLIFFMQPGNALYGLLRPSDSWVWGPGDGPQPTPGGFAVAWPAEDTAAASEYHLTFIYGGAQALSVSDIAPRAKAWIWTSD